MVAKIGFEQLRQAASDDCPLHLAQGGAEVGEQIRRCVPRLPYAGHLKHTPCLLVVSELLGRQLADHRAAMRVSADEPVGPRDLHRLHEPCCETRRALSRCLVA